MTDATNTAQSEATTAVDPTDSTTVDEPTTTDVTTGETTTADQTTGETTTTGTTDPTDTDTDADGMVFPERIEIFGVDDTIAHDVGVDGAGNIYLLARSSGVDFGGGPVGEDLDLVLAKLTPAGEHVWSKAFPCPSGVISSGDGDELMIAVNGPGEVAVLGIYGGMCDFGGDSITHDAEWADVFVAAFDAAGHYRWNNSFGGEDGELQRPKSVALDDAGRVSVIFQSLYPITVDMQVLDGAIFVELAAEDGAITTAMQLSQDSSAARVAVDGAGNRYVFVPYEGEGPLIVGGEDLGENMGEFALFSTTADGTYRWHRWMSACDARQLDVSDAGVLVVGEGEGAMDCGAGPIDVGDGGSVLARLNLLGEAVGNTLVPGLVADFANPTCAGLAKGGEMAFCGTYQGQAHPDLGLPVSPMGRQFLLHFAPNGQFAWGSSYGTTSRNTFDSPTADGLAMTDSGHMLLVGTYFDDIDIAQPSLAVVDRPTMFLASFAPGE